MKHVADDIVEPERELALGTVAEYLELPLPELPQKWRQLLEMYGRVCFDKGETYAHDKDTLVQSPRSHAGSGVFGEVADSIAAVLDEDSDADHDGEPDPNKTPVRRLPSRGRRRPKG